VNKITSVRYDTFNKPYSGSYKSSTIEDKLNRSGRTLGDAFVDLSPSEPDEVLLLARAYTNTDLTKIIVYSRVLTKADITQLPPDLKDQDAININEIQDLMDHIAEYDVGTDYVYVCNRSDSAPPNTAAITAHYLKQAEKTILKFQNGQLVETHENPAVLMFNGSGTDLVPGTPVEPALCALLNHLYSDDNKTHTDPGS